MALLLQLLPAILNVIPAVEKLFGPTSGNGHVKAATAMDMLTQFVPTLEDAFNVKPEYRAVVSAAISLVYELLKVSGTLQELVAAPHQPAPTPAVLVNNNPASE